MPTITSVHRLLGVLIFLVVCATSFADRIVYVDADAIGANDGSSWADAYNYLQDALADANSAEKPVDVWVAQGVYKPDQGAGQAPGDREATFQLINGATLKGGYAGLGEPDPDVRDIETYQTILSGDLAGNDLDVDAPPALQDDPSRAENSEHVVTGSSTDKAAVLDGFWITAGHGVGGAGMFNVFSSPTITNCTFYHNVANVAGFGGGMYNCDSNPDVTNCDFVRNYGGGMYNDNGSPRVADCTFIENQAHMWGGGMSNTWYSKPRLTDCTFRGNHAHAGGAIDNSTESKPTLVNCTFTDNGAGVAGAIRNAGSSLTLTGCLFSENSAGRAAGAVSNDIWASLTLTDCTLIENSADEQGGAVFNDGILMATGCTFTRNYLTHSGRLSSDDGGGAIYNRNFSNVMLTRCTFEANAASKGGAVFNWWPGDKAVFAECRFSRNTATHPAAEADKCAGGAIYNDTSNFSLFDCSFTGNTTTGRGGAIYNWKTDPKLTNCLFTGNTAAEGGAIYDGGVISALTNCTFAQNSAARGTSLAYDLFSVGKPREIVNSILWDRPEQISINERSVITIAYSDIRGGCAGEGNIDVDPCFADAGYWDANGTAEDSSDDFWIDGDYHLQSQAGRWEPAMQTWVKDDVTSPCIDAGDLMSPIAHEPFPNGGRINMGAYGGTVEASKSYFGEPVCGTIVAGDIDGNCTVDISDFAIMCYHWLFRGADFVNTPPRVTITEPADGAVFDYPMPVRIRADASDVDGSVLEVKFIRRHRTNGGTVTTSVTDSDGADGWDTYWYWWGATDQAETYWSIWAEATDDDGAVNVSPKVTITTYMPVPGGQEE